MFKKVPYGVKVRIKGNSMSGYRVEECIKSIWFAPFFDTWCNMIKYSGGKKIEVFDNFEDAQEFAQECYDKWIKYYNEKEESAKIEKRIAKTVAWQIPA